MFSGRRSRPTRAAASVISMPGSTRCDSGSPRVRRSAPTHADRASLRLRVVLDVLAALGREETAQQTATLLGEHARHDLDPVIEPRLVHDVEHGATTTRLGIE